MRADDDDRLTRQQVASLLGCSKELVRDYERRGRLTAFKQTNGIVVYAVAEIEEFRKTFVLNTKYSIKRKPQPDEGGEKLRKVLQAMRRGVQSVTKLILETGASPQIIARAKELDEMSAADLVKELREKEAEREAKLAKKKRDREAWVHDKMRQATLREQAKARAGGAG